MSPKELRDLEKLVNSVKIRRTKEETKKLSNDLWKILKIGDSIDTQILGVLCLEKIKKQEIQARNKRSNILYTFKLNEIAGVPICVKRDTTVIFDVSSEKKKRGLR